MGHIERIDSYKEDMLKDLKGLLEFPSVVAAQDKDMPFGKDVHGAFMYMLELGREAGFDVYNADNYGGHIEMPGNPGEEVMGVLAHVDVVPAGDDWTYPPYAGTVVENKLFGRGTIDDKGPAIAAFYAMKALKEEGFAPVKTIRLILGLDEEAGTGWLGMEEYFKRAGKPDFGFTPDADFPVIHGEKGILIFDIARKLGRDRPAGIEVRSIKGGNAANMVADRAKALVRSHDYDRVKDLLELFRNETGHKITGRMLGKSFEIMAYGISAHGSLPHLGKNAISILMAFLGRLEDQMGFANEELADFVAFYNNHIGFNFHGEEIGCDLSDEASGRLVFNVGVVEMDKNAIRLTVNIRYPVTLDEDAIYGSMMPYLDKNHIGLVRLSHQPPIYLPVDNPLIQTLMEVYREQTGDYDSKPVVIGGGTYARAMDRGVAFGMAFPGEPEIAHQKDEYVDIDNLIKATKIYAESIYRLTK